MSAGRQTLWQLQWTVGSVRRRTFAATRRAFRSLVPFGRLQLKSFLFAPPDLRTADPTIASDIYAGQFVFAGRAVDVRGQSPFDVAAPSIGWAETLYGFGWLRHLQAANTALARENARGLLRDFMVRPPAPVACSPHVVCRRLMALLSRSPLVLDGADHAFYAQYLKLVRADALRLQHAIHASDNPLVRLNCVIALTALALCVEGAETTLSRCDRLIGDMLDEQIFSDGGHVSRNPRVLIDLLLDLLPLRSTYAARQIEAPSGLMSAVDRIVPHLKMLRHADGSIALFNGMGASQVDALATIFASHGSGGRAAMEAPYTGYQRLEMGPAVLIAETGPSPPFAASAEASAGCLSFEFSYDRQRIFVNCGTLRSGVREFPVELRATAAHTATILADTSSCRFLTRNGETRIVAGPRHVTALRTIDSVGETITMTHDGYRGTFGVDLHRTLVLAQDGSQISGREALVGSAHGLSDAGAMVTRFHLHPSVNATMQSSDTLVLTTPRGGEWSFGCENAKLQLEESVFFASIDGARRTSQIVLIARDLSVPVTWSLQRLAE